MNNHIEKIKTIIEPLREQIVNHKIFSVIKDIDDLKVFMQYHVYAVWDFMSLLKTLQKNLTCTTVPWFPNGAAETRYLINEIVVGEESDLDSFGNRKSHFEIYLDAMEQCGADTNEIKKFISVLKDTSDFNIAYTVANTPKESREFVDFTFKIINSDSKHLQSSIFTFGREDLIPDMFISLVNDIQKNLPNSISIFKYYLDRHIEIDGNHHSDLAMQMTANLCSKDEQFWKEAELATIESLQMRIKLFDGAYKQIQNKRTNILM
jgi:hypothetical protein